jgi:DNA repair exonuclease SbcCD ATPase subunit
MKTTLKSIDSQNWRGFTGLIEFNPERNVFSGPNGSGKTRIPDAVSWCLTGKDTRGKADSELKSIVDGAPVQKSEHSIILTYDVDGQEKVFGRCYYEKWSTKRGSAEKTKDGNQTKFEVDGIEISKTKYNAAVLDTFGPNYFLCSDLSAVTGMEWKKRRELLSGMADLDDIAVGIEPELDGLLKGRTIEDAKTAADQRKKALKKKIADTNAALEERQADVDRVGGVNSVNARNEVESAELAVNDAKAAIEKAKGGDQSGNIEKLKKLNDQLFKAQSDFQNALQKAKVYAVDMFKRIERIEDDIKNQQLDLIDHQSQRESLLTEYHNIKNRQPGDIVNCPTCHRQFPDDQLEEKKESFNRDKSNDLEKNMARGLDIKKEIGRIEATISERQAELEKLQAVEPDPILSQQTTPEIDELKKKISQLNQGSQQAEVSAELLQTLEACEARLKQAQETRAAVKASAESVQRLEELKKKKTELSSENDRIEKFLSLHQQYEQALADAIEKPVNDMFETAYFKMFDTLEKADEDGNFKQVPACIVMDKEKRPFDTALSNGERIQLQLDVARVMQKHFDIYAPIFVDNAEALTPAIEMNCQVIELRHNAGLETLTKEV